MQITLAVQRQTPARMLGQGVKHVVQETNAGVDADGLRLARLAGVVLALEETGVGVWVEAPAVEIQRKLDLGLVGVARKSGPAGRVFSSSHFVIGCILSYSKKDPCKCLLSSVAANTFNFRERNRRHQVND